MPLQTVATNYTDLRQNLKDYCNKTQEGKAVVVARRDGDVVLLSLDNYNELQNELYLADILKSLDQLQQGHVIIKTDEELEAMAR